MDHLIGLATAVLGGAAIAMAIAGATGAAIQNDWEAVGVAVMIAVVAAVLMGAGIAFT